MGNSLFQVLSASIRAKITPLVTKFRLWTSWNFIRTRVITRVRIFLVKLFDVKPRHKKDYYEVFGWMVSKRLAFAAVVAIGILSVYYLLCVHTTLLMSQGTGAQVKTYAYNSLFLRTAKGNVRITGKSGYLAYEGNVSRGAVNGNGRLYNPEGTLVYNGSFENSRFEGSGSQYYDTGVLHYQGDFSDNLYEGTGKLYHANGCLSYEGEFARGLKEGSGVLFDLGGSQVYEGAFSSGEIVYSALLGKSTQEVSKCYYGRRTLYEDEAEFAVILEDIGAAYIGRANANALDDEVKVEQVYVLKDSFFMGGKELKSLDELTAYLGNMIYQGNSDITMTEAVCIDYLGGLGKETGLDAAVELTGSYDDYFVVRGYDREAMVYLYSFQKEGMVYTFVCPDKGEPFIFYSIMSEKGGVS